MEIREEAHDGHRLRLRERVVENSLDELAVHEVVEYLLCYVIPRQDVNALAHALLEEFGSLHALLRADIAALARVRGMGQYAANWFAFVDEMLRAADLMAQEEADEVNCFLDLYLYASRTERDFAPPCTLQLCLDIEGEMMSRILIPSRAWGEPEYQRRLITHVLESHASSVVLVQFTGRESADPEEYDVRCAGSYSSSLQAAGCSLMDVVLAGDGETISMRRLGMIPERSITDVQRSLRENYLRSMPDLSTLRWKDFRREE